MSTGPTEPQGQPQQQTDPSQFSPAVQSMAAGVKKILIHGEQIRYIAVQNNTAMSLSKAGVVATTHRLIVYTPGLMGKVSFTDLAWKDLQDVHVKQGTFSAELHYATIDGRRGVLGNLDKDQTLRLYAVCQQQEHEWHEQRRQRDLEDARARAGGFQMTMPPQMMHAPPAPPAVQSLSAEDPVARLAKAKAMLDQGLIGQDEYNDLKARILGSL